MSVTLPFGCPSTSAEAALNGSFLESAWFVRVVRRGQIPVLFSVSSLPLQLDFWDVNGYGVRRTRQ